VLFKAQKSDTENDDFFILLSHSLELKDIFNSSVDKQDNPNYYKTA